MWGHRNNARASTGFRAIAGVLMASVAVACLCSAARGQAASLPDGTSGISGQPTGELRQGRELLQTQQFAAAKTLFAGYLRGHPGDVQAELGLGDAELGLREYEAAEQTYRKVVAKEPELWQAHKNLVVVEAALGRWEEFDRERTVLRLAREREAPGISAHESDVIDRFTVHGQHWVVRAYFEPVGRSRAVYNFERFSPEGRAVAFVSLEPSDAAQAALATGGAVRIGGAGGSATPPVSTYALNWYNGQAHGTVVTFGGEEPSYERARAALMHWLQRSRRQGRQGPQPAQE